MRQRRFIKRFIWRIASWSEEALIRCAAEHPKLMERPTVVANGRAHWPTAGAGAGHPRLIAERYAVAAY